jgi:hypothetical protein
MFMKHIYHEVAIIMRTHYLRRKAARAWLALAIFVAFSCCGAWAAGRDASCTPSFPLEAGVTNGWQGADVGYSIPLKDGRDLWIFGDTLYGKKRVVHGEIPVMVHSSLGISTCEAGKWKVNYFLRRDAKGQPVSFFHEQRPGTYYWAMGGFRAGSDVWITLLCVRPAPAESAAMAFATCGTDLARLSDLGPDPLKWKVKYFPLVADGAKAYPSATSVVKDGNAEIFALYETGSRPLLASRIPLNGLNDPKGNLKYLAKDGKWKKGFDPASALEVMKKGSPELSIVYHPELHKWLAVMFEPDGFSRDILLKSAPSSTGPWTDGQVIYKVPEMDPGSPSYDKETFCYAGKEHPEFEHGDLVFTYACNTFSMSKLASNLKLYFPRAVRMPMPTLKDEASK